MRLLQTRVLAGCAIAMGLSAGQQQATDNAAQRDASTTVVSSPQDAAEHARMWAQSYKLDQLATQKQLNDAEYNTREAVQRTSTELNSAAGRAGAAMKKNGQRWVEWAREQGFVPQPRDGPDPPGPSKPDPKRMLHADELEQNFQEMNSVEKEFWARKAVYADEREKQQVGTMADKMPQVTDPQATWFQMRAKEWMGTQPSAKDAFDDRVQGWENVGQGFADAGQDVADFTDEYLKKRGEYWVGRAQQRGWMPSERSPHEIIYGSDGSANGSDNNANTVTPSDQASAQPQQRANADSAPASGGPSRRLAEQQQQKHDAKGKDESFVDWARREGLFNDNSRRLDAYDDRMEKYADRADYEREYYKIRGEQWAQWAKDHGYVPPPPAPTQGSMGSAENKGESDMRIADIGADGSAELSSDGPLISHQEPISDQWMDHARAASQETRASGENPVIKAGGHVVDAGERVAARGGMVVERTGERWSDRWSAADQARQAVEEHHRERDAARAAEAAAAAAGGQQQGASAAADNKQQVDPSKRKLRGA